MPAAVAIPLAFAVSAGAVGGSVLQAESQKRAQKRALKSQEEAQRQATQRAARAQRIAQEELRRATSNEPDIGNLLRGTSRDGPAATSLTGAQGVARLLLGRTSLLGAS